MKNYCQEAIDAALQLGAAYADVRVISYRREDIFLRNGKPGNLNFSESTGAGIRVIVNGAWGFASIVDVNTANIKTCAQRAVAIARASAQVKKQDVKLAPRQPVE